jgi:predicted transcriptional regulator
MGTEKFHERVLLNVIDKVVLGSIAALIVILFNNQNDRYLKMRNASIAIATQNSTFLAAALSQIIEDNDEYIATLEDLQTNELQLDPALRRLSGIKRKQERLISKIKALFAKSDNFLDNLTDEMQKINNGLHEHLLETPETRAANRKAIMEHVEGYLKEYRIVYANFLPQYGELSRRILRQDFQKVI